MERRGKATVSQEEVKEQEAKGQEPQESQIRVEKQDLNIHFSRGRESDLGEGDVI